MPRVSVVVPSYNHAAFVGEAVTSILNQSESDLEVIVVDDGSVDRSREVLRQLHDRRLRILEQDNRGAHEAINRGLREASGDYLAILNSDDAFDPARLEKALGVFERNASVGLVGSQIEIVDHEGRTLGVKHGYLDCPPWVLAQPDRSFRAGHDLRAALLTENYWATTSNFVFRRSLFEAVGEFRRLRFAHDWDFALRASRHARLVLLEEPLLRYRVHSSNTIRTNRPAMIFEVCWCLATHLPQHVRDSWFSSTESSERADQCLHSIYAFGMERVIVWLMLERLSDEPERAASYLDPENASRQACIAWIVQELARQEGGIKE